ncbi:MAG: hypothetical protein R6U96_10665 [Promethearchaeia archaeon]
MSAHKEIKNEDNSGPSEQKSSSIEKQDDVPKKKIKKEDVPHFFPTYRIKGSLYSVPIIIVVVCAGILAYLTYVEAGVRVDGTYISEEQYGAAGGILNGLIFTALAAVSAFVMIFLIKKFGINLLKYLFGLSFGFIGFFLSLFFSQIFTYLIFINFPETEFIVSTYYLIVEWILPISIGLFTIVLIYNYFTTKSIKIKNFIVLYIGLLIGAMMGIIMPLWTTLAILIGVSLWDIFAVKSKRGPIKQMIDIAGSSFQHEDREDVSGLNQEEIQDKIESGELMYDTSHLEIGIGDLAFYSMLTTAALLRTSSIIVMIFTATAIIIGTGITISGLKRNKILPGLPISIFLGITAMLISWGIIMFFS